MKWIHSYKSSNNSKSNNSIRLLFISWYWAGEIINDNWLPVKMFLFNALTFYKTHFTFELIGNIPVLTHVQIKKHIDSNHIKNISKWMAGILFKIHFHLHISTLANAYIAIWFTRLDTLFFLFKTWRRIKKITCLWRILLPSNSCSIQSKKYF